MIMKKGIIIIGIIAVLCVVVFVLLNNVDGDLNMNNKTENDTQEKQEKILKYNYKGVNLVLGKAFNSKDIDAEPKVSRIPSCAFDGEDDVYTYEDVEITANKNDDSEIIYSIYFLNDSIKTDEGLAIADDVEKMESIYGKDYTKENERIFVYKYDNANLEITIDNDVVTGIEYVLIVK